MKKIKRFLVLCLACAMIAGIMVIPANAVFTRDNATEYVKQLYNGLLGREPDDGGLTSFVDRLYNQNVSAGVVAESILGSPEFKGRQLTNEQYIDVLYLGLLGRNADPEGKANFLSLMACGQSRAWVYLQFLGSPEYKSRCENHFNMYVGDYPTGPDTPNPDPTNVNVAEASKFVEALYQNLLGREADAAGKQNWLNMLSLRKMSAAGVACAVASSAEFNSISYTNSEFINRCYLALLGRKYDVAGYTNFINALNSGKSRSWVFASICNSAEFQRRAAFAPGEANVTPGTINPQGKNVGGNAVNADLAAQYVRRLYASLLNRNATDDEVQKWVEKLVNRLLSAAGVAAEIAASPEAKAIGLTREQFVARLYEALLGRAPDSLGNADFTRALTQGYSRSWVFCKICASPEFQSQSLLGDMNVVPGTLNYASYDMG